MSNSIKISIVIPAYKCSEHIQELYNRLIISLEKITDSFEIIFVNDGSPDNDWEIIGEIASKDKRVRGINLSRNFGQHYAITAGLDHTLGDWIVVMDCDLQDQPEEIEKLYKMAMEGYDIVFAKRENRQDGFIKKITSKIFYKILSYLTGVKQDETVANFGVYSKKAIEATMNLRENLRYFPVLIRWVGFETKAVSVEHSANKDRRSSYSLRNLFDLAFNVMISTSNKPLKLVTGLGLLISLTSFIFAIYLFIKTLSGSYLISGWPSLIVSIWFLSGIIILTLGVIGLYLGKTFDEVKNKPLYIVKDNINCDK